VYRILAYTIRCLRTFTATGWGTRIVCRYGMTPRPASDLLLQAKYIKKRRGPMNFGLFWCGNNHPICDDRQEGETWQQQQRAFVNYISRRVGCNQREEMRSLLSEIQSADTNCAMIKALSDFLMDMANAFGSYMLLCPECANHLFLFLFRLMGKEPPEIGGGEDMIYCPFPPYGKMTVSECNALQE